ncbi:hypothetical protein AN1V17_33550 [Vallitalea sediminicola]
MLRKRLKQLRISKGLTQERFANILGISRARYNNFETGKRTPNDDIKIQIASFYGVSIDYMIGQTDNPTPYDKPKLEINDKHIDKEIHKLIVKVEKTNGLIFDGCVIDEPTKEVLIKMLKTTKAIVKKMNENNKKQINFYKNSGI